MKHVIIAVLATVVLASVSLPVTAGEPTYGFKFGGYVKADAMWDNARIYPGNYQMWVVDETEKNNAFYLTANETRLGFDFWWDEDTYKTTAKIEFDFQGGGPATNKSNPMMRHAYIKLAADNWALLFGQTWDIISPLNPKTVNYSVQWAQGNIGYRRPQMRVTYKIKPGENSTIKFDAGIMRNIGLDLDDNGVDDGADAGLPSFQGRVGFGTPMGEEGKLSIGVSGHYGTEKYTDASTDEIDAMDTPSWSVNGDLAIKINKRFALLGEFFMGENLNQYLGGILQGVDPLGNPVQSMGGWGLLQVKASKKTLLNFGYGFDDPDDSKWKAGEEAGETYTLRDLNSEAYGNVMYSLTKNVSLMFELAYLQTKYTYTTDGVSTTEDFDAMRFQFAVKAAIK